MEHSYTMFTFQPLAQPHIALIWTSLALKSAQSPVWESKPFKTPGMTDRTVLSEVRCTEPENVLYDLKPPSQSKRAGTSQEIRVDGGIS